MGLAHWRLTTQLVNVFWCGTDAAGLVCLQHGAGVDVFCWCGRCLPSEFAWMVYW